MFVWNRAELLVTTSLEYYLQVEALMRKHGIKIQTRSIKIPQAVPQIGEDGMLQRSATRYYIYIHKEDMVQAADLVGNLTPEPMIGPAFVW